MPEDQARCVAREPEPPPVDLRIVPRALLALPRLLFRTATEIVYLGARFEDEYRLLHRIDGLLWNDARTFGITPVLLYGTGLGTNIGAQAVHHDLFGAGEGLRLRAAYGGADRQLYDARIDTGRRLESVRPSLTIGFARDDRGRFYGIGNAEQAELADVDAPLDAQRPGAAVRGDYIREELRAQAAAEVALGRRWSGRVLHLWRRRALSTGRGEDQDDPWVTDVFARDTLVGLEAALLDAYSEIALAFDGRRSERLGIPYELPSSGLRAMVWAGLQTEVNEPYSAFGRAGFDLQPFIDLYRGDRILRLRLRGASVLGPLGAIPFIDLPGLGGSTLLRGYDSNRFHGRVTMLASAEYRYPVQEGIAAYVFTDVGRAWAGFEDITFASLRSVRVGFGVGLQVYNPRGALIRVQLASSIDGGFFLHLELNTSDEPGPTH